MRFSSAIALAVVTVLASSASAHCDLFCLTDSDCNTCMAGLYFLLWLSESCFCFHNGAVWPLALTHEKLLQWPDSE
ncbi:hypothetical protein EDD22DRAFT_871292 [Suillus occidentalis]|nr:hypothetical protein EDD22DRAFT_871292 [Suillus occidentalis]